jgi:hypothetical protein
MKKEILEALRAKFQGVSESVLNRIADKLAKTVTSTEQVTSAVEDVTIQQVIESYGDSRATEAQQTAIRNYENKYGLKDGAKISGDNAGGQAANNVTTGQSAGADDTPAWAKVLFEQNRNLTEKLNKFEVERTTATRRQQLSTIVGKLPENLRKPYERTAVENLSEDEFNSLVQEITTEVEGIVKETQARGVVFGRPAANNSSVNQGNELTKEQAEAIAQRDTKPADGQPF